MIDVLIRYTICTGKCHFFHDVLPVVARPIIARGRAHRDPNDAPYVVVTSIRPQRERRQSPQCACTCSRPAEPSQQPRLHSISHLPHTAQSADACFAPRGRLGEGPRACAAFTSGAGASSFSAWSQSKAQLLPHANVHGQTRRARAIGPRSHRSSTSLCNARHALGQ